MYKEKKKKKKRDNRINLLFPSFEEELIEEKFTPGAGRFKLWSFSDAFAPSVCVQLGIRKFKLDDWAAPCISDPV